MVYKKFIIKLFIIVISLYIGYTYIIKYQKMWYLDSEYPMWLHVKTTMNANIPLNYNTLMLGDSGAKAGFIPTQDILKKSINLSLGGSTPVEAYYILKHYLKNNNTPLQVILAFGTGHLNGGSTYWYRTVKFDFLDEYEYEEIENLAKRFQEKDIISFKKSYKDYKNIPALYGKSFLNGIIQQRWVSNEEILNECFISKGHYYFGKLSSAPGYPKEMFKNRKKRIFTPSKLQDFYLTKLLTLMKLYNVKSYFYKMPYIQSVHKYRDKEYVKGYESYLHDLSWKFNMKICNKLWYLSNDNFGDNNHLYKGASKVTSKIFKCLNEESKIENVK